MQATVGRPHARRITISSARGLADAGTLFRDLVRAGKAGRCGLSMGCRTITCFLWYSGLPEESPMEIAINLG
jgi:hypothetical protein